jgi:inosose dehydratase
VAETARQARVRLATGPVCWGVDFADAPGNPPYREVLDGVAAAGYRWLELGPTGYLPAAAASELAGRGLCVTAGLLFEPLHEPALRAGIVRAARRAAVAAAAAGCRFLVVVPGVTPERAATAGRDADAPRLGRRGQTALQQGLATVAEIARDHGLRPLLHPHAGSYVEFRDEIEPLLDLVELCLDTGHLAYAGLDPVEAYRRWAERIPYLHLKDVDPRRRAGDFWASVRAGVFRPVGDGCVDFPELVRALDAHGYDGWAVVEQDRRPGAGDPVADLVASRLRLEGLLAGVPG